MYSTATQLESMLAMANLLLYYIAF